MRDKLICIGLIISFVMLLVSLAYNAKLLKKIKKYDEANSEANAILDNIENKLKSSDKNS